MLQINVHSRICVANRMLADLNPWNVGADRCKLALTFREREGVMLARTAVHEKEDECFVPARC